MKVNIYGHSDDLVEIEGEITKEFELESVANTQIVTFTDGTRVEIRYEPEMNTKMKHIDWHIMDVTPGNKLSAHTIAVGHFNDYSQSVTLKFNDEVELATQMQTTAS